MKKILLNKKKTKCNIKKNKWLRNINEVQEFV